MAREIPPLPGRGPASLKPHSLNEGPDRASSRSRSLEARQLGGDHDRLDDETDPHASKKDSYPMSQPPGGRPPRKNRRSSPRTTLMMSRSNRPDLLVAADADLGAPLRDDLFEGVKPPQVLRERVPEENRHHQTSQIDVSATGRPTGRCVASESRCHCRHYEKGLREDVEKAGDSRISPSLRPVLPDNLYAAFDGRRLSPLTRLRAMTGGSGRIRRRHLSQTPVRRLRPSRARPPRQARSTPRTAPTSATARGMSCTDRGLAERARSRR
jgi:hypothetical protein